MRPGIVGAILGIALGAALAWSCSIERPSEQLRCFNNDSSTCETGRVCQNGYCVVGQRPADARELDAAVCPSICNGGCDFATSTCTITGTGSGNIVCPTAWNCNIGCPTPNACGAINCGNAASCDIDCVANDACLTIQCLTKNCDITCTGTNACSNISSTTGSVTATCTGSGACDNLMCGTGNCTQTCSDGGGSAVCGTMTCDSTGSCNRTCTGAGACGSTACNGSGPCTTTCSGGLDACGPLLCTQGPCTANCQGSGTGTESSCANVTCGDACQCDVECDDTTNICPGAMLCPSAGQDECTETGNAGARCDSDFKPQCKC